MNRRERRAQWLAQFRRCGILSERSAAADNAAADRAAARNTAGPGIRVHIARLSLQGFATRDGAAVGEAVRYELTQLITEHGLPARLTTPGFTDRIDAGQLTLPAQARAERIGTHVARAVHGGSP